MANPLRWIPTNQPFTLPADVERMVQTLHRAGHEAYVVGGSVRDFMLGLEPKDHDIATSAKPDQIVALFPGSITVGKAFGVIKVPSAQKDGTTATVEIATFRKDLEYKDHRHPVGVEFAGPVEDARRRDFTINALFYDPKTKSVLDTVGGISDLHAKVIRAIGDADARFEEDALRLIRAVRFATVLGFQIEEKTLAAIQRKAPLIKKVSYERIRAEFAPMISGPRPADAIEQLSALGLLREILPELEALRGVEQPPAHHPEGDVWTHTLKVLRALSAHHPTGRSATLSWAALLHDVGKPVAARRSGGQNFHGHESDGVRIAQDICQRFKLTNEERERICQMIGEHLKFTNVFEMKRSTLLRWLRQPYFKELLELHRADRMGSSGDLQHYEFCREQLDELARTPGPEQARLLTGKDLIELGFSPGPRFSEILEEVEDLVLERKIQTRDEALAYVRRLLTAS